MISVTCRLYPRLMIAPLMFTGPEPWMSTVAPLRVSGPDASTVTLTPLMVMLDPASGREIWRAKRTEPYNWAAPYVARHDGRRQIIVSGLTVRSYDDVTEMLPFNQMLRTRVAFQSDSDAIPVTRAEGITTVAVRPGGGRSERPGRRGAIRA